MTETKYKKTVTFVDANRQRVTVELAIKDGEFSASGDCGNSCGQIVDSITPATDAQRVLVELWREWHLNYMNAGTPEQTAAVKAWLKAGNAYDYDKVVAMLKERGLYKVPTPIGSGEGMYYTYGSAWLKRELPEDWEEQLDGLVEELNDEVQGEKVQASNTAHRRAVVDLGHEGAEFELVLALAVMLELTVAELDDIDIDDAPQVKVQGTYYLAGNDDEMDKAWDESLDSYLDECVLGELPDFAQTYFDREKWKDDARIDGRAHSLNRYDGNELEAEVDGKTYYAYRQ